MGVTVPTNLKWIGLIVLMFGVLANSAFGQSPKAPNVSEGQTAQAPMPTASAEADRSDQYQIGSRDVLTIRVTAGHIVQELSLEAVEVNECGRIPLLSVYQEAQNEIQAAGKTPRQLAEELRAFYLKYKRNPQVVVAVKEYNSQPVVINGAIVKPGMFQMRRPVHLLELVQFYAGGPTAAAGGRVQLGRMPLGTDCSIASSNEAIQVIDRNTDPTFMSFKLDELLAGVDQANPLLQPGDVITVPEAQEAYIIGNVSRIGPIPLRSDSISMTRALALAGGTLPDTQKDKILIHRPDPKGGNTTKEMVVDLNAISKHLVPDFDVLPNDIIEVQVNGGKRFLRTLSGAVVPAVAQMPVRIIP
jgi:polysaccharide export outer membrane protein